MFGRGRIDHLALLAASVDAFREIRARLIACGASDGFVTDVGSQLSIFSATRTGSNAKCAFRIQMHGPVS